MKYKIAFAVLVGLLAVYVGYFASLPVPDGLPEPWKMRALTMFRYTVSSKDHFYLLDYSQTLNLGWARKGQFFLILIDSDLLYFLSFFLDSPSYPSIPGLNLFPGHE